MIFFVTSEALRQQFSCMTKAYVKIIAISPHGWQKNCCFMPWTHKLLKRISGPDFTIVTKAGLFWLNISMSQQLVCDLMQTQGMALWHHICPLAQRWSSQRWIDFVPPIIQGSACKKTQICVNELGHHWFRWLVTCWMTRHYLDHWWHVVKWTLRTSVKLKSKYNNLCWRKCISKCCLHIDSHFVLASMDLV